MDNLVKIFHSFLIWKLRRLFYFWSFISDRKKHVGFFPSQGSKPSRTCMWLSQKTYFMPEAILVTIVRVFAFFFLWQRILLEDVLSTCRKLLQQESSLFTLLNIFWIATLVHVCMLFYGSTAKIFCVLLEVREKIVNTQKNK